MNAHTETVVGWVLSTPVLTKRLLDIAQDDLVYGDDELPCTVVDLLDPGRDKRASAFLAATGACPVHADAVWALLSGGNVKRWNWIDDVRWDVVRDVLFNSNITALINEEEV